MKKAVLLQLPVPGHLWPNLDTNIPLAAGYLAAWARLRLAGWRVEILPWHEADVLGDEALFRGIVRRQPDVVGLSLYLWNVERSLCLARRLSNAGIPVVVGGPEVEPDNAWLWDSGSFDAGVVGEGEEAFVLALDALARNRPLDGIPGLVTPAGLAGSVSRPHVCEVSRLPSPYLEGILAPFPDGSVWIETQRGCPFRCAYCNYGKQYEGPQVFPRRWLRSHLEWAAKSGAREVYLMDPSFNARGDWKELLSALEEGNAGAGLALHAEIVADVLRPGDALRLARSGLRSCEVGLQTANTDVLARLGRPWHPRRWVRGVSELLDGGISVVVGLIVGLPGDDLAGFERTLAFLRREVPAASIQVFPLALLPGTELRRKSASLGLEWLPRPPYTVTRTPGYSARELGLAFELFEESMGLELECFGPLPLEGSWQCPPEGERPYVSGVLLEAAQADRAWPAAVAHRAARNLCIWVKGWRTTTPAELGDLSRLLPHGVLTVVLEDEPGWPPERLSSILCEAGTGIHYLDRYFGFLYGPEAVVVPRLAALLSEGARADESWLDEVRQKADIVWAVNAGPGWCERAERGTREGDAAFVRGEPAIEEVERLSLALPTEAGDVLFEAPSAALLWRNLRTAGGPAADVGPFRVAEERISVP